MAKLLDFRETYYEFSGKASDAARNLALAGIAVVWIFRIGEGSASRLPQPLIWAVCLFALALALDLLHYSLAAVTWGTFHWLKEKAGASEESKLTAPRWLNWIPILFWGFKIVSVIVGHAFLGRFLLGILFPTVG